MNNCYLFLPSRLQALPPFNGFLTCTEDKLYVGNQGNIMHTTFFEGATTVTFLSMLLATRLTGAGGGGVRKFYQFPMPLALAQVIPADPSGRLTGRPPVLGRGPTSSMSSRATGSSGPRVTFAQTAPQGCIGSPIKQQSVS